MTKHTGLALSVRQPFADMIIFGHKSYEFRSFSTKVRGLIWIYASKNKTAPGYKPGLPIGLIIGTAVLTECTELDEDDWQWHLEEPVAWDKPKAFRSGTPQPVWWRPTGLFIPR